MIFYNSFSCVFLLLNLDELRNKFYNDIIVDGHIKKYGYNYIVFDEHIKKYGYIINVKFKYGHIVKLFYIVDMLRFISDESISSDSDVLLLKKLIRFNKIEKLRNVI